MPENDNMGQWQYGDAAYGSQPSGEQVPQQYPSQQQWQQPQQHPSQDSYAQSQQYQQQGSYPQQFPQQYQQQQVPYSQQGQYPQQAPQQYGGQYGDPSAMQPQPSYGQMPYGQGYDPNQPQPSYSVPMNQQMDDAMAKNAWICLAIGVFGMILLAFGKVWGVLLCCLGISVGIKGIYSKARVAAIIGIVLNSISLVISVLSTVATCSEMF